MKLLPSHIGFTARELHQIGLRRSTDLGIRIDDSAWNMLLILFANEHEGLASSVTSLVAASGTSHTTALRYLKCLEGAGLISRQEDQRDKRRILIISAPGLKQKMNDIILGYCMTPPAA